MRQWLHLFPKFPYLCQWRWTEPSEKHDYVWTPDFYFSHSHQLVQVPVIAYEIFHPLTIGGHITSSKPLLDLGFDGVVTCKPPNSEPPPPPRPSNTRMSESAKPGLYGGGEPRSQRRVSSWVVMV
jgi:hypothetical protein